MILQQTVVGPKSFSEFADVAEAGTSMPLCQGNGSAQSFCTMTTRMTVRQEEGRGEGEDIGEGKWGREGGGGGEEWYHNSTRVLAEFSKTVSVHWDTLSVVFAA